MSYFEFNNKKIYYKVTGKGQPLLLLHGNSASSNMFGGIMTLYSSLYQVILIDYPGHGKSEKVDEFEKDFWYYNALVCNALLDNLGLEKVAVVGTSGGALIGINLALEYPVKVSFLVADSFCGEYPSPYMRTIRDDRDYTRKNLFNRLYWRYMHGKGWRKIVDSDTDVIAKFALSGKSFFHKSVSELKAPTLFVGSREDELCDGLDNIYDKMKSKNDLIQIYMFDKGKHPAILTNKQEFFELVKTLVK